MLDHYRHVALVAPSWLEMVALTSDSQDMPGK